MRRSVIRETRRPMAAASVVSVAATILLGPMPTSAQAAALEQTVPATIRLLYQEGRYGEIGFAWTDPSQSGEGLTVPPNGQGIPPGFYPGNTGDVFDPRWAISAAFKGDINDRLSYAVIFDQPYGARTDYGAGSFILPFYQGSNADLKTYQLTGALAYDVTPAIKLFGGLRAQRLDAKAAVPFVAGYSVDAGRDWGYGYLLGAAYERPEIALRIALTYYSKIAHDLDTDETITAASGARVTTPTSTDVDTPQSVSLDFQTGIDPKTLVFGSIRWVDWSQFSIDPPVYERAITGLIGTPRPLVDYADDSWTYTLGLGRQLTDALAGSLSISWEPSVGGIMTTLGPYDGRTTGTAALTYEVGRVDITGGVTYGVLGDTRNLLGTDFNDGSVWGVGLRVGYSF